MQTPGTPPPPLFSNFQWFTPKRISQGVSKAQIQLELDASGVSFAAISWPLWGEEVAPFRGWEVSVQRRLTSSLTHWRNQNGAQPRQSAFNSLFPEHVHDSYIFPRLRLERCTVTGRSCFSAECSCKPGRPFWSQSNWS